MNQRLAQLKDATPFTLGAQLDRLVVVGVDWTLDPDDAAAAVSAALEAHAATNGYVVVPIGTPTNNTGSGPSGLSSGGENPDPAPPTSRPHGTPGKFDALELLRRGLGLPPTALAPDAVPYGDLAEQRLMLHMINALWRGTLGNYLSLMWNLYGGETKYVTSTPSPCCVSTPWHICALRDRCRAYAWASNRTASCRWSHRSFVPAATVETRSVKLLGRAASALAAGQQDRAAPAGTEPRQAARADPERAVVGYREGPRRREPELLAGGEPARGLRRDPQWALKDRLAREILAAFGIVKGDGEPPLIEHVTRIPRIAGLRACPGSSPIRWIPSASGRQSETLSPNYIQAHQRCARERSQAKNELWKRENGSSLLEALLAFSAEEEFDRPDCRSSSTR